MKYILHEGDNVATLKEYPDNHFDSIVTDPPYGIAFLGKDWDNNTGAVETWEECLRVLKPGGHLLAFSAARTYHHLATNIEGVGFEIRDQLMWLYGSGFPKAQDIGKALDKRGTDNDLHGWKTALKPAHEPIVFARKPFNGSCVDNVLEHGVGAMNIDASRVPFSQDDDSRIGKGYEHQASAQVMPGQSKKGLGHQQSLYPSDEGRYPSNVIMDSATGNILDLQAPSTGNASSSKRTKTGMTGSGNSLSWHKNAGDSNGISDGLSGASKFFYCPKVSRKERHIGFEQKPEIIKYNNPEEMKNHPLWDPSIGNNSHRLTQKIREEQKKGSLSHIATYDRREDGLEAAGFQGLSQLNERKNNRPRGEAFGDGNLLTDATTSAGNNHPTVKPVELMKYLIKLVTPAGGLVLDPFNGSGSTGMAAVELGYEYTGCELDPEYIEIATKRIEGWYEHTRPDTNFNDLFSD